MRVPRGFEADRIGEVVLISRTGAAEPLRRAGLDRPAEWERLCAAASQGPGRGAIARVDLPGLGRAVLKRLRRGGWIAPIWQGRMLGSSRGIANLEVAREAVRRGIPTAEPIALLLRQGPPGLFRAWLATEEIDGAADLLTRFRARAEPSAGLLPAALRFVRRAHDEGLSHPDLNFGNLLARERADGEWELFVVDLDRAAFSVGPLRFAARQAALRRFERSAVKHFGADGPPGAPPRSSWGALYASGEPELARRLAAGRRAGENWLAIHRLGWSRGGTSAPPRDEGRKRP